MIINLSKLIHFIAQFLMLIDYADPSFRKLNVNNLVCFWVYKLMMRIITAGKTGIQGKPLLLGEVPWYIEPIPTKIAAQGVILQKVHFFHL